MWKKICLLTLLVSALVVPLTAGAEEVGSGTTRYNWGTTIDGTTHRIIVLGTNASLSLTDQVRAAEGRDMLMWLHNESTGTRSGQFVNPTQRQIEHPSGTLRGNMYVQYGDRVVMMVDSHLGTVGTSSSAQFKRVYRIMDTRITQIEWYGHTWNVVPGQDKIEVITNVRSNVALNGNTTNVVETWVRYNGSNSATKKWEGGGIPGSSHGEVLWVRYAATTNYFAPRVNGITPSPASSSTDNYLASVTLPNLTRAVNNSVITNPWNWTTGSSNQSMSTSQTGVRRLTLSSPSNQPANNGSTYTRIGQWNNFSITGTDGHGERTTATANRFFINTTSQLPLTMAYGSGAVNASGSSINGSTYTGGTATQPCGGENGWTRYPLTFTAGSTATMWSGSNYTRRLIVNGSQTNNSTGPAVRSGYSTNTSASGHTVTAEAFGTDGTTSISGRSSATFKIDTTPPTAHVSYNSGTNTFSTNNSTDALSGISTTRPVRVAITTSSSTTSPADNQYYAPGSVPTSPGTYYMWAMATDRAGNVTRTRMSGTITISAGEGPAITIRYASGQTNKSGTNIGGNLYNKTNSVTNNDDGEDGWTNKTLNITATPHSSSVAPYRTQLTVNTHMTAVNNGSVSNNNYATETTAAHSANGTPIQAVLTQQTSPFAEISAVAYSYVKIDRAPPSANVSYNATMRRFDVSASSDGRSGLSNTRPVRIALTTTTSAPADSAYQHPSEITIPTSGTYYMWAWATDKAGNEAKTRMPSQVTFSKEVAPALTMRYRAGSVNKAGMNIGGNFYSKTNSVANNDDGEEGWTNKQLDIAVTPPGSGGGSTWVTMGTANARMEHEIVNPGVRSWIRVFDDATGNHEDTPEYLFPASSTSSTGTLHRYDGPYLHPTGNTMNGHVNLGTAIMAMWESVGGVNGTSGTASWTRYYRFDPSQISQIRVYGRTFTVVPGQDRLEIVTNITTSVSAVGVTSNSVSTYARYNGISTTTQTWTGADVPGTALSGNVEYRVASTNSFRTVLNINGSNAAVDNNGGVASVSNYATNTQLAHRINGTEMFGVLTQRVSPFNEISDRAYGYVKMDRDLPTAHVSYNATTRKFDVSGSNDTLSGLSNTRPVRVALTTTMSAPADSAYQLPNAITVPNSGTYYMWAWATDKAGNETKTRMSTTVTFTSETEATPILTMRYAAGMMNKDGIYIGGNLYSKENSVANNDDGEDGWTNKRLDIAVTPSGGGGSTWVKLGTANARMEHENVEPGVRSWIKVFDDATGSHEDTPEYLFPDSSTIASGTLHRYVGPFVHPTGTTMNGHVNLGTSVLAMWESIGGVNGTSGTASWTRYYKFDTSRISQVRVYGRTFTVVPGQDRLEIVTNITTSVSLSGVTTNTVNTYARYNGVSSTIQTWTGADVPGTALSGDVEYHVADSNNFRTVLNINGSDAAVNGSGGVASVSNYLTNTLLSQRIDGTSVYGVLTQRTSPFNEISDRAEGYIKLDMVPPVASVTYDAATRTFSNDSSDELSGLSNTRPVRIALTTSSSATSPAESEYRTFNDLTVPSTGTYYVWAWATDRAGNETKTRMPSPILFDVGTPTLTMRYQSGTMNAAGVNIGGSLYSSTNSLLNNDDGEEGWTNKRLDITVTPPAGLSSGASAWVKLGTVNASLEHENTEPGVRSRIKAFDNRTGTHEDTPEYLFPESSTIASGTLHRYVGPFVHPTGTTMNGHVNLGTSVMAMWESIGGVNGTSGTASWTRYYRFDPSRISQIRVYGSTFTVVPGQDRLEIVTNITTSVSLSGVTTNTVNTYARYNGISTTTQTWTGADVPGTALSGDVEYHVAVGNNLRTVLNINGIEEAINTNGGIATRPNYLVPTSDMQKLLGTPVFGVMTERVAPFMEVSARATGHAKMDTIPPVAHGTYSGGVFTDNSSDTLSGLSNTRKTQVAFTFITTTPPDSDFYDYDALPTLAPGFYRLHVRATDKAGNVGNWTNLTSIIIVPEVSSVETKFTKVGAGNINVGLSGAEFALYRWMDPTAPTVLDRNQIVDSTQLVDGNWTRVKFNGVNATSTNDVFASATAPLGEVDFGSLPNGVYTIIETKAPTGYEIPIGQWVLTVNALNNDTAGNWKIDFVGKSASIAPPAAIRDESIPGAPTYKIINAEPFSIGMSGLAGTSGIILIGFALMAIAGNAYIVMSRKRKKGTRRREQ